jgi:hypothetical protein
LFDKPPALARFVLLINLTLQTTKPLKEETFEKCFPPLAGFKFKSKIPDFERGKTKILTIGIH